MRTALQRSALLLGLLVVLVGCGGLSKEEKTVFEGHVQNAQRYYDRGRYVQAEQQARKAMDFKPKDKKANLLLAWTLLQLGSPGQLREALARFESLEGRDGKDFRITHGLATAQYRLSLLRAQQVVTLEAEDPRDEVLLQQAIRERDGYQEAAKQMYIKTLELNEDYPEALSNLGQIYALENKSEMALAKLERFLVLAEQTRRYLEEKRTRLITDDQALILDEKITRNIDREVSVRDLVANILYKEGRTDEAIDQLDRILALRHGWTDLYLNRARCLARLGRFQEAIRDVETFLKKTDRRFEDQLVQAANSLLKDYAQKL